MGERDVCAYGQEVDVVSPKKAAHKHESAGCDVLQSLTSQEAFSTACLAGSATPVHALTAYRAPRGNAMDLHMLAKSR